MMRGKWMFAAAAVATMTIAGAALGNGLMGHGVGARAMGVAGANTAWAESALGAMQHNPAQLALLTNQSIELGGMAAFGSGRYRNRIGSQSSLGHDLGAVPAGALAARVTEQWAAGLSVAPQTALDAEWDFVDPPGGADGNTSYGRQKHRSRILVLRSAAGASWAPVPEFAVGASVGLLYNENKLEAPYTFQTQPTLRGAKVLLDLETAGYGWDAEGGAVWRPHPQWQFGLSYQTRATVRSEGEASGHAGVQLANLGLGSARPDFHYDAEVRNVFPQQASLGASWEITSAWRVLGQIDWMDWSDSFDTLPVRLRAGNNADLNALVKSSGLDDDIPLNWRDRLVFRAGAVFSPGWHWRLRGGYSYGRNPVPSGTLTPLTAAISEHTIAVGGGWENRRTFVDVAWQWAVPNRERVGRSELRSGDYSGSEVRVGIHWIAITAGWRF